MMKKRFPFSTAGLLAGLLGLALARPLAASSEIDALWVAESDGAVKISAADGSLLVEITEVSDVRAVAVDLRLSRVWLLDQGTLHGFDLEGDVVLEIPVSAPSSVHAELAVQPADSAVWLAVNSELWNFGSEGQLLSSFEMAGNVEALAVDAVASELWIATQNSVSAHDAVSGEEIRSIELESGERVRDLAVDGLQGKLWLALKDRLRVYDTDGTPRLELPLQHLERVAIDRRGGAWLATYKEVHRLDGFGVVLASAEPLAGAGTLGELAVGLDRTVWVANQTDIAHLEESGEIREILSFEPPVRIWDLATPEDSIPPVLEITSPDDRACLGSSTPVVELTYSDVGAGVEPETLSIELDGSSLAASCTAGDSAASCQVLDPLSEGEATLTAAVRDFAGNTSPPAAVQVTIDVTPPEILLQQPTDGALTNESAQSFLGALSEEADLSLDGVPVPLGSDLLFSFGPVALNEGENVFNLLAVDCAGNGGQLSVTVTLDTVPPTSVDAALLSVEGPQNGGVTLSGPAQTAEAGATLSVTNPRSGETATAAVAADGSFVVAIGAQEGDELSVVVIDGAGNQSTVTSVMIGGDPLPPPDPSTVATEIDPTVATDIAAATEFLHTGAARIQTDVVPGAIDPRRVAIVRGTVSDREGDPLSGVRVTVKDHPELGATLSRQDGAFDLAVNGGGVLVMEFRRDGFLPVQRRVETPWRNFLVLDNVALVSLDDEVTVVSSGAAESQTARGSLVEDEDGARQATLLFPPATGAQLVFPDGSTQPLPSLSVRATEYTVGPNGPQAMPAPLPPTSGYTYAVELGADEALAAEAERVVFDRPVSFYVENFLDFPVGGVVPAGYYDRDLAAWIPSDNGRVIAVLSVTGGFAALDVDGSGHAAGAAALAELGIGDDELRQLAALYQPGQSLWRVPISHFSPYDANWPNGPPPDAVDPPDPGGDDDDDDDDADDDDPEDNDDDAQDEDEPDCLPGSIIECQNQILRKSIRLPGTPFRLHYSSARVPGRAAARSAEIRLSGSTLPPSLKRIALEVRIAGQRHLLTFPAEPDQRKTFVWDGRDAYGRTLRGRHSATFTVGYVYDGFYYPPADFERAFGFAPTSTQQLPVQTRVEVVLRTSSTRMLGGSLQLPPKELGGWSLGVHHRYDPGGRQLHLGTGQRRGATDLTRVIRRFAGQTEVPGSSGDGGPALEALLGSPIGLALAADGSLYIADASAHKIRRVGPDGIIETVAGTGVRGSDGNGGPATEGRLSFPVELALAPDGSLYFVENTASPFRCLRKVDADGILSTLRCETTGMDVAVGSEGELYVARQTLNEVIRISPNGTVRPFAGTGEWGFSGDGGPAIEARLAFPDKVAVDSQGRVFIHDQLNRRIRVVTPDGIINTFAGRGVLGTNGDGGPAIDAEILAVRGMTVTPDGSLYFAQWWSSREDGRGVRRISPTGIITTVAGSDRTGHRGDGGPANAAEFYSPSDVVVMPDGRFFISDANCRVVRVVGPALPGSDVDLVIPSADGRSLYAFDGSGRHLRTLNALTGAVLLSFSYDSEGLLSAVTDADGNTTTIVRDGEGNPQAVEGPFGQRVELVPDANGYLAEVRTPGGATTRFTYSPDGLLTSMTDPREGVSSYEYSPLGRLVEARDAAGAVKRFSRRVAGDDYQVKVTSAMGLETRYRVTNLANGDQRRRTIAPNGLVTEPILGTDGSRRVQLPDGTVISSTLQGDPRFAMRSPYEGDWNIRTPSGLSATLLQDRQVSLAAPDDPLSLVSSLETWQLNGWSYTVAFDATERRFTLTSPEGRAAEGTVDQRGLWLTAGVSGVEPLRFTYDEVGRLSTVRRGQGDEERLHTFHYRDSDGRLRKILGPLDRSLGFEHDADGHVTGLTLAGGRDVAFGYDAAGNLVSLTPPGRPAHAFRYTATDLTDQYNPPDVGIAQDETTYVFDLDRQLTQVIRPGGQNFDFDYDEAGRPSSVVFPGGARSYSYDTLTGKLRTVTAPDGVLELTYDGLLLAASTWSGEVTGVVERTYNEDFEISSETINGGHAVAYQYDLDGLLVKAGDLSFSLDARNGALTGSSIGQITTSWAKNPFGEPEETVARYGASLMYSAAYTRDKLGRIVRKIETIGGVPETFDYAYDEAGRLRGVSRNGAVISEYTYDANSNRTSYQSAGGSIVANYDEQDRLLEYGSTSFTYTDNGELAGKTANGQTITYGYDAFGNLRSVSMPGGIELEYVIGPRNRLLGKKVNGVLVADFLYRDRLNPIAQTDGNGNVVARFVYGVLPFTPAYFEKGGRTYRIIADHLGSVRLVVDVESGEIAQRMDYDEFGRVIFDSNPGFQPFGYIGGIYDSHTRLLRLGRRDYDAEVGRWTAKDSSRFRDSFNLYSYCRQDPINFLDPNGENPVAAAGTIAAHTVPRLPAAGLLAGLDGPLPILDILATAVVIEGIIEGILVVFAEDNRDDSYKDQRDTEEARDEEERNLDKLRDPPNPKDVERRRQRHRDQIDGDMEDLLDKYFEIKREWPGQPAGKAKQRIDAKAKDDSCR